MAETLLAWHWRLVAQKYDDVRPRQSRDLTVYHATAERQVSLLSLYIALNCRRIVDVAKSDCR